MRTKTSLSLRLLLPQVAIVLSTIVVAGLLVLHLQQQRIREEYRERVQNVATNVARLPSVLNAYDDPVPSAALQPLADVIRQASVMTFVVFTDAAGIRHSHPDRARIGERVSTDPAPALAGKVFVGTETGTLGESLRAKVPIRDAGGRIVGAASVGILESQLTGTYWDDIPDVVGWLGGAALLGSLGSALLAWTVRPGRQRPAGGPGDGVASAPHLAEPLRHARQSGTGLDQRDVDRIRQARQPTLDTPPPKGLSPRTLDLVTATLQASDGVDLSADEVAQRCEMSRRTANRYLRYLEKVGLAIVRPRFGQPGRPENGYLWVE